MYSLSLPGPTSGNYVFKSSWSDERGLCLVLVPVVCFACIYTRRCVFLHSVIGRAIVSHACCLCACVDVNLPACHLNTGAVAMGFPRICIYSERHDQLKHTTRTEPHSQPSLATSSTLSLKILQANAVSSSLTFNAGINRITSNTDVVKISMPFSRHFFATRLPISLTRLEC